MNFEPYLQDAQLDPIDRWCKRFVLVVGPLLLLFLLTGCASMDYSWQKPREAAPKPWFYVVVENPDAVCRPLLGARSSKVGRINACAAWGEQQCTIYLPRSASLWLIEHEEKHCEGYTHD